MDDKLDKIKHSPYSNNGIWGVLVYLTFRCIRLADCTLPLGRNPVPNGDSA